MTNRVIINWSIVLARKSDLLINPLRLTAGVHSNLVEKTAWHLCGFQRQAEPGSRFASGLFFAWEGFPGFYPVYCRHTNTEKRLDFPYASRFLLIFKIWLSTVLGKQAALGVTRSLPADPEFFAAIPAVLP